MALFLPLGYLIVVMAVGYTINRLMAPLLGRRWRLFVAPGVIAHELAHALACVLVGARVHEINFWKPAGGHVIHGPPRLHLIGPVLIALAPTVMMTLGLFGLAPLLETGAAELPWTQTPPESWNAAVVGYLTAVGTALTRFDWTTFRPYLFIYVMLNVAVTMAPSRIDLANSKWSLLALFFLVGIFHSLFAVRYSLGSLWPLIATSLVWLGLALLAALSVRGLVWIVVGLKRS